MADLRRVLERVLAPLHQRLRLLISRAVVKRVSDGGGQLQVALLGDEVADRVERWGTVGVASSPLEGSEQLVVAVGASRSHLVAVAGDDRRHRPTDLEAGEVVIYAPDGSTATIRCVGGEIRLEAGSEITIEAGSKITVEASDVEIGSGSGLALLNETLLTWLETHTHPGDDEPPSQLPIPPTVKTTATKAS